MVPADQNAEVEIKEIPSQKLYERPDLPAMKARGANQVAQGIVWIFAIALGVLLVGSFIVVILLVAKGENAEAGQGVIRDWMLPLIQGIAEFASSVFGPLLAFVLGYYFGEGSRKQRVSKEE